MKNIQSELQKENPMGHAPIGKTLAKFAIPTVISNLVTSVYNLTDQIFIGQGVGMLGNAATNVAFPIHVICMAVSLMIGIGGAINFNLAMGRGDKERATKVVGSTFSCLVISGLVIFAGVKLFLNPLMVLFGATAEIMDYAITYVSITNIGIPFLMMTLGGSHMVRSDGKPMYSMIAVGTGAVINIILDPLFIFVFQWGIKGAAFATVISQVISAVLIVGYLPRYQSVKLSLNNFVPKFSYVKDIASLGAAAFISQISIFAVQIVMNNTLKYYGALSIYGSEIPLAAMGIISKISMIVASVVFGIAQGGQPIIGFNYGAKKYNRVRKTYRYVLISATAFAFIAFACFQLFPETIIGWFGTTDYVLYHDFAIRLLRVYMMFVFLTGCTSVTSNFFTGIGKPVKGTILSLARQVIFSLPLILLLPGFFGIDGFVYAGPIGDLCAFLFAAVMVIHEFRNMPKDSQ